MPGLPSPAGTGGSGGVGNAGTTAGFTSGIAAGITSAHVAPGHRTAADISARAHSHCATLLHIDLESYALLIDCAIAPDLRIDGKTRLSQLCVDAPVLTQYIDS